MFSEDTEVSDERISTEKNEVFSFAGNSLPAGTVGSKRFASDEAEADRTGAGTGFHSSAGYGTSPQQRRKTFGFDGGTCRTDCGAWNADPCYRGLSENGSGKIP